MEPDIEQAKKFFKMLWCHFEDTMAAGQIVVWTDYDNRSVFVDASKPDKAAEVAMEMDRICEKHASRPKGNVYAGVGLQKISLPCSKRGRESTVCSIPGFWMDLDVLGPTHKCKLLPPSVDSVESLIKEVYPNSPPTLVVFTGGGLQPYWLFDGPLLIRNDTEIVPVKKSVAEWWDPLQAYALGKYGWKTDSVNDLSRVLRVPGTWNRKKDGFVQAKILAVNDRRYKLEELTCPPPVPHFERIVKTNIRAATIAHVNEPKITRGARDKWHDRIKANGGDEYFQGRSENGMGDRTFSDIRYLAHDLAIPMDDAITMIRTRCEQVGEDGILEDPEYWQDRVDKYCTLTAMGGHLPPLARMALKAKPPEQAVAQPKADSTCFDPVDTVFDMDRPKPPVPAPPSNDDDLIFNSARPIPATPISEDPFEYVEYEQNWEEAMYAIKGSPIAEYVKAMREMSDKMPLDFFLLDSIMTAGLILTANQIRFGVHASACDCIWPNVFGMKLAPPATGKGVTSRFLVYGVLPKFNLQTLKGVSAPAIIKYAQEDGSPFGLYYIDEVRKIADSRNVVAMNIVDVLNGAFDTGCLDFQTCNRNNYVNLCLRPAYPSLMIDGQPHVLESVGNKSIINTGFLTRFLIVMPTGGALKTGEPALERLYEAYRPYVQAPVMKIVTYKAKEVDCRAERWNKYMDDDEKFCWYRLRGQYVVKLAAMLQPDCFQSGKLAAESMDRAGALLSWFFGNSVRALGLLHSDDEELLRAKAIRFMQRQKKEGREKTSERSLYRHLHCSRRGWNECAQTLEASELAYCVEDDQERRYWVLGTPKMDQKP